MNAVGSFSADGMFVVVVDVVAIVIVGNNQLVYRLIEFARYSRPALHLPWVQEDLVDQLLYCVCWQLLVYYFLVTLVLVAFQPVLSQQLQQIFPAVPDPPQLLHLSK